MDQRRIHILCLKPEICSLIKKGLNENYRVSCSKGDEINEELISNFEEKIDCLILDKDIDLNLREKIKTKFENIAIICLPSLDSENNNNRSGVKNMSEPLRLSELADYINSIFKT